MPLCQILRLPPSHGRQFGIELLRDFFRALSLESRSKQDCMSNLSKLSDKEIDILLTVFEEHRKEIERSCEDACKDFVHRFWELDYTTKLGDLKRYLF